MLYTKNLTVLVPLDLPYLELTLSNQLPVERCGTIHREVIVNYREAFKKTCLIKPYQSSLQKPSYIIILPQTAQISFDK